MANKNQQSAKDFFADMIASWSSEQQNLWKDWLDNASQSASDFNSVSETAEKWRDMASDNYSTWFEQVEPTAKATMQNLLDSQQKWIKLMTQFSQGLDNITKSNLADGDWQKAMNQYIEQFQANLNAMPQQWMSGSESTKDLWSEFSKQVQQFFSPWQKVMTDSMGLFSGTNTDGSAFSEFMNLNFQAYQDTTGKMVGSPTLGLSREYEEKLRQYFISWVEHNQANYEFQLVIGEAWVLVMETLRDKFISLSAEGKTITTLAELTTIWNETADPAFLEIFQSEKYIKAQAKYLNTVMKNRIQQRAFVEQCSQMLDIPTRTEVDEAHRLNYQQGKLIKSLNKDLVETKAQMAELQKAVAELKAKPEVKPEVTTPVAKKPVAKEPAAKKPVAKKAAAKKPAAKKPAAKKPVAKKAAPKKAAPKKAADSAKG